jgi:hypothetical protein
MFGSYCQNEAKYPHSKTGRYPNLATSSKTGLRWAPAGGAATLVKTKVPLCPACAHEHATGKAVHSAAATLVFKPEGHGHA